MADQESEREDLLREATALVERIKLRRADTSAEFRPGSPTHVVVGFRSNGAVSIFFDTDPVYQFNADSELRRAYCANLLYKAENRRLVSLQRLRRLGEVQLLRHDLTEAEQNAFMAAMHTRLRDLSDDLRAGCYEEIAQVPERADVRRRVEAWLTDIGRLSIARTPRV